MKRAFKSEATSVGGFSPVDLEALPADMQRKYSAYRKAEADARNARLQLEAAFIAAGRKSKKIGPSESYAFGYKFGGFAFKVIDADEVRVTKAAKAKVDPFA